MGILTSLVLSSAYASDADIFATFDKIGYNKSDVSISDTPMPNMKSVSTPGGKFYISNDGQFLTQGPIYNMSGKKPENIANSDNLKLISTIAKDAIIYQAPNEKYRVYVFSDYTCVYCKKLHSEIQSYLDKGISIYYFAFPRAGLDSDVAKNMQSIWSVKDRNAAFDNAYKDGKITPATSMVPYVKMQYEVGHKLGLSGTPAIILPNGELLAGYVPADKLLEILEQTK